MTGEFVLFVILAVVAVLAALAMLLSPNAVHSALFLVINFASVAVLYLLLNAPFIALAQITVYAGAIMVLFLFVIMLLGVERLRQPERGLPFQMPLAIGLTVVLLLALGSVVLSNGLAVGTGEPVDVAQFSAPDLLAAMLYSDYLFPFEVTSLLLLVAMIGVVVLTRDERAAAKSRAQRRAEARDRAMGTTSTTSATSTTGTAASIRRNP